MVMFTKQDAREVWARVSGGRETVPLEDVPYADLAVLCQVFDLPTVASLCGCTLDDLRHRRSSRGFASAVAVHEAAFWQCMIEAKASDVGLAMDTLRDVCRNARSAMARVTAARHILDVHQSGKPIETSGTHEDAVTREAVIASALALTEQFTAEAAQRKALETH